jgi:hypothetical protein
MWITDGERESTSVEDFFFSRALDLTLSAEP